MTPAVRSVLAELSGLVRLPCRAVGQAQAAQLLGCPTVQPLPASAHMSIAGT